ncbi:MAG: MFS transporter [Armatimonadota bacterium]
MTLRADRNLQRLFAALLLWMLGVALYEGLIPIYARQLGASAVQLGTLFTVRAIALAAGFLIGWIVADRVSRRTLLFASWWLGLPVPLLLAAAPGYLWLLPGIILYELTFFALPALHAYVAERVPASELASAFSAMGTISSVGFLISPTAGGFIADRWGIQTTLVIAFMVFALSTILVLRMEGSGPGTMPAGGAGPLRWAELRPLVPALAIYVAVNFIILITVPFMSPYLREVRKLSLSAIGFLASMQALGAVVLTPIIGRLGDRWGHAPTLVGSLGVNAVGMLLTSHGPGALLPVGAALRCRAPLNTLAQAMIGARAPSAILGRAFALAGMLAAGLAAIGSFVGGFAYRANTAYPLVISACVAVAMALTLLWLRMAPKAAAPVESQVHHDA